MVLSAAAERPGMGLNPEQQQLFEECLAAGSMQRLDDATHIKQINCIVRGLLTSFSLSSSLQEQQQVVTQLQPLLGKTLQLLSSSTSGSYISTVQHLQSILSAVAAINLRARETAAAADFVRDWSNALLLYYALELAKHSRGGCSSLACHSLTKQPELCRCWQPVQRLGCILQLW